MIARLLFILLLKAVIYTDIFRAVVRCYLSHINRFDAVFYDLDKY